MKQGQVQIQQPRGRPLSQTPARNLLHQALRVRKTDIRRSRGEKARARERYRSGYNLVAARVNGSGIAVELRRELPQSSGEQGMNGVNE